MKGRVAELDGVRGVAIALVVLSHAAGGAFLQQGGRVGVILFFALSGYLITALLLHELDQRGRIRLLRFWERRARRLLPAFLVFVVLDMLLWAGLSGLRHVPLVLVAAPVMNVLLAQGGGLATLEHLWSLAVEEQFYLLWPLAVSLLVRGPVVRRLVWAVSGFLVWRCLLLLLGMNAWVHYGPDTNAYALLLGALVAGAAHHGWTAPQVATPAGLAALGVLALVPVGWEASLWLQPVAGFAGAAVVAGAPRLAGLTWAPLRYAGRVSYGLYLWHVPLLGVAESSELGVWGRSGAVVVAVVVAAASFELLERRFLRRRAPSGHPAVASVA